MDRQGMTLSVQRETLPIRVKTLAINGLRGNTLGAASRSAAPSLCVGCLRDMNKYGDPASRYCDACHLAIRRYPDRDLRDIPNGRSEVMLCERPIVDPTWRTEASCNGAPPELFEPRDLGNGSTPPEARDVARVFCAHCPVIERCAAEADAHRYEGIYGGSWRYVVQERSGAYKGQPLFPGAPAVHVPTRKAA